MLISAYNGLGVSGQADYDFLKAINIKQEKSRANLKPVRLTPLLIA
ncbi:hypothetical protein SAMN06265219_113151 [Gracilimonas mengyeensis]|uniref:Uncharacterized protein n=1 Tax=Gracilimonas mengyeensis TaxID=1302730 RepID=A0A521EWB2_9BACT|nr:hypothetical protein SAMN06265219_113151 [Gracilimonas mengyeensis]